MPAFWSGTSSAFLAAQDDAILGEISRHQIWHFRSTEAAQSPAWRDSIIALKDALRVLAAGGFPVFVLLEYPILRLGKRIDAVLLADRAIFVLEFKREQHDADALRQTEDYALDLHDFHEHCRHHVVVPVLVTGGVARHGTMDLLLPGHVSPVQVLHPAQLGAGLLALLRRMPAPAQAINPAAWARGAYRPVPTIIEAACMLYARHGVEEIRQAQADKPNLHGTTTAIRDAIAEAQARDQKIVLFVTGIPGAGKTLCGLNAAFGDEALRGTFLTGNPTLVHVLREALARDAIAQSADARVARARMESVIQALPRFRNHYLTMPDECPPETVIVIDEAQRCWSRDYAIRKTRDKAVPLHDSEPGHLLDIIGRHEGFAALICLVGSGQEIHDGEGGLAEWGSALRIRPDWQAICAPDGEGTDPRRHLGAVPGLRAHTLMHLEVPVRQVRRPAASAWVDAVLGLHAVAARAIAQQAGDVPYWITRDLDAMRRGLRGLARGERRAGLLASAGARRLRAEGLGAELPHMDAAAVAHWFLDRFPADVRASDALEQVATEFSCQGLELDFVGLCWDADLIRAADGASWVARNFVGTKWQTIRSTEAIANQMNTYRVLLTRARYDTIIFIPRGDAQDMTRDPATYDRIAEYLLQCGAREWAALPAQAASPIPAELVLL